MKKDEEIDASSGISHLSKRTPKDGSRTERTWYLIWKAADRCLLKVGHSAAGRSPFRCKLFWNKFKVNFVSQVTSRKIKLVESVTGYRTDFFDGHFCGFLLVTWVSHDFASRRRACLTQLRDRFYGSRLVARQAVERQLNHNMAF